jgi:hypothetical protein
MAAHIMQDHDGLEEGGDSGATENRSASSIMEKGLIDFNPWGSGAFCRRL